MLGWASTTSWIKKQYFNGMHLIDVASSTSNLKCPYICIFGIRFTLSNQKQKKLAMALYQSILWFTYRQNISFKSGASQQTNDIGWGCMLRVGQMMLAQTLRVHAGIEKYSDQKFIDQILQNFVTSKQGKFTIQRLCEAGQAKIDKKVGEWYTPADIAFAIQQLTEREKKASLGLQVIVTNSQFQINGVLEKVWHQGKKTIKPLLMIVLVRIGFQKAQEILLNNIVKILSEETSCIGILGGRPGKAHYIVGSTDNLFIYLDPHCVKNEQDIQSFWPQTLLTIKHDKIDPSMGVCFYVNSLKDILNLHGYLQTLENSPIYAYTQGNQKVEYYECKSQQEQQEFEQLRFSEGLKEF